MNTTDVNPDELHRNILIAHDIGDHDRLARLYDQAGDYLMNDGQTDAAYFFFTQAYVFALETGSPETTRLARLLTDAGRL